MQILFSVLSIMKVNINVKQSSIFVLKVVTKTAPWEYYKLWQKSNRFRVTQSLTTSRKKQKGLFFNRSMLVSGR